MKKINNENKKRMIEYNKKFILFALFFLIPYYFWGFILLTGLVREIQYSKLNGNDFLTVEGTISKYGNYNEYIRKTRVKLKWIGFEESDEKYYVNLGMLNEPVISNIQNLKLGSEVKIKIVKKELFGTRLFSWFSLTMSKNLIYGLSTGENVVFNTSLYRDQIKKNAHFVIFPIILAIIFIFPLFFVICLYRLGKKNYLTAIEVNKSKPKWYLKRLKEMEKNAG